jgi:hypothetical protein
MDVERDVMERDDSGGGFGDDGWDVGRLGRAMSASVEAWVNFGCELDDEKVRDGKESILEEVAGTLKDVLQELDSREENAVLGEEEAMAVCETLHNLQVSSYVRK